MIDEVDTMVDEDDFDKLFGITVDDSIGSMFVNVAGVVDTTIDEDDFDKLFGITVDDSIGRISVNVDCETVTV